MSKPFFRTAAFLIAMSLACASSFAQADPNPDSPSPVLLSDASGSRVLALNSRKWEGNIPAVGQQVFYPGQKSYITIFLKELDLMPDEGANSLRVFIRHANGKAYEMGSVEISAANKTTHALKVWLYDLQGLRGQPPATGDALIYVSWRGLASNMLKIGLGRTGGKIEIPEVPQVKPFDGPVNEAIGYRWSGDRVRFMEQAAFGPSPGLDDMIRRIGPRAWLAMQFEAAYPSYEPYPNIPQMPAVPPNNCSQATAPVCFNQRYTMMPLQDWFFKEAFYGGAQLRHRVSWALGQIWVTSGLDVQQSSHMIAYQKVLSDNAFGNYRDLMYQGTLNPAMGHYLDMIRSTKNNPNENFAREILQLFSVGLFRLNQDGTKQLDGNNQPIPTYDQAAVNGFTKVFTGWTFCNTTGCPNAAFGIQNYKDPMLLIPADHDTGAKTLMTYPGAVHSTIPACADCSTPELTQAYAYDSLNKALDNIFNHPTVGPYIGKLLIQHMVMSDPSPSYVSRVAAVFNNNGYGVRGDMKAVIRAILLDPEARGNIKTDPRYGKLREPVQVMTNLARQFPATSWDGQSLSDGSVSSRLQTVGQNPYYSPTVFNYFSPDYVVPNTTLIGPEFGILNTGTSISRTNLLYILIFEGLTPSITSLRGTALSYNEVLPLAQNDPTGNDMMDWLNAKMMHGDMLPAQRTAILNAVAAVPASDPLRRVKTAVYLLAASSQYQVQR